MKSEGLTDFAQDPWENMPDKVSQSAQTSPDLGELRTILALDRTLLAWVRTALTLVGCGFTLAKFVYSMIESHEIVGLRAGFPRELGFSLMALGVFGLLGGIIQYLNARKKLPSAGTIWPVSIMVAIGLVVLSVWLFLTLVFELKPV